MENQNLKNKIRKILDPKCFYDLRNCTPEEVKALSEILKVGVEDIAPFIEEYSLTKGKRAVWVFFKETEESFELVVDLHKEIKTFNFKNNLENLSDDTLLSLEEFGYTKEELNQDTDLEVVRKVLESRGEAYSIPSVLEVIAEYKGMEYEELLSLLELTHERN